jgi:hypothetical protein
MQIGRRSRRLLALLLGLQLLLGAGSVGALAADPQPGQGNGRSHLKVVIVVGPVGGLTDTYRALANGAAKAARARTDNVVTVYSPNATWPAVRRALDGASIVVYLGHGNGFPSPYRDALYGLTQNGFGLNPIAGVDDRAHQYFGEYYLSHYVRLAPGAVVILGHLCYASGNPEPGGPDPTLGVAQQRVDNYAAGWLAAGASAVVAEGHGRPSYYVTALLKGRGTIEQMWRAAPTFHDHVVESPSARTPGTAVMLDPDRRRRGYFRSLVAIPGARIADTLAGAPTTAPGRTPAPDGPQETTAPAEPESPSPADRGAQFGAPLIEGRTVAASEAKLSIPVDAATLQLLPEGVSIGTRWDPLIVVAPTKSVVPPTDASAQPSAPRSGPGASPGPSAARAASGSPSVAPPPSPAPSAEAAASADAPLPDEPPTIDLIGPEVLGTMVVVAPSVRTQVGLTGPLTLPAEPGLYRLVATLHDSDGVAFDAETQDLLPALLVRVTAPLSASYAVPAELRTTTAEALSVRVRVANTGTTPWSEPSVMDPTTGRPIGPDGAPHLVARWIGLDEGAAVAPPGSFGAVRADIQPGREAVLDLELTSPTMPGRYLIIFDLQTDDGLPLASLGVPPGLTRVVVGPVSPGLDRRRPAHGGTEANT